MRTPFGQILAFVRATGDEGPILAVMPNTGVADEVGQAGDICDHEFAVPDARGLLLWSGWVEVGIGPDPDVIMVGEWRRLTHWELCRVRYGLAPWYEAEVDNG